MNDKGNDSEADMVEEFTVDENETLTRVLPDRFRAVEGITMDWSGTWTRIEGRRFKIEYRKGGETLTADVTLGFGHLPAEGSSTETVVGLGGPRTNSSDGNNGHYYLRPNGPGRWRGTYDAPRGKGRVELTEY